MNLRVKHRTYLKKTASLRQVHTTTEIIISAHIAEISVCTKTKYKTHVHLLCTLFREQLLLTFTAGKRGF
jgi:hypothetical protein